MTVFAFDAVSYHQRSLIQKILQINIAPSFSQCVCSSDMFRWKLVLNFCHNKFNWLKDRRLRLSKDNDNRYENVISKQKFALS